MKEVLSANRRIVLINWMLENLPTVLFASVKLQNFGPTLAVFRRESNLIYFINMAIMGCVLFEITDSVLRYVVWYRYHVFLGLHVIVTLFLNLSLV